MRYIKLPESYPIKDVDVHVVTVVKWRYANVKVVYPGKHYEI